MIQALASCGMGKILTWRAVSLAFGNTLHFSSSLYDSRSKVLNKTFNLGAISLGDAFSLDAVCMGCQWVQACLARVVV